MNKNYLIGLLLSTFIFVYSLSIIGQAQATTINLDAHTHIIGTGVSSNPYQMTFDAGDYQIFPIGISDGGQFNAYSPWSFNSGDCLTNPSCIPGEGTGYMYRFGVNNGSELLIDPALTWDGLVYASSIDALQNAKSSGEYYITLTQTTTLDFFIPTGFPLNDNRGGISLTVNPVPVPATILLFGTSLAGLVSYRIRRKKK